MSSSAIRILLVGGSYDGSARVVRPHQRSVYLQKPLTVEESKALAIDGEIAWKPPEEVYEKGDDGRFHYARTVHYKPDDIYKHDDACGVPTSGAGLAAEEDQRAEDHSA